MTSGSTRRTLGGLTPKVPKQAGIDRLIKANRTDSSTAAGNAVQYEPPVPADNLPAATLETLQDTNSVTNRVPKYLQLKRREARIYDEQADALTVLARQINNQRKQPDGKTTGERITDNTLLRVAIDLLLERKEEIRGTTEQEIAANLGLEPRHLG